MQANPQNDLADLLADHLRAEEALLTAALPVLRAVQAGFKDRSKDGLPTGTAEQQRLALLVNDMMERRRCWRGDLARRLQCPVGVVSVTRILERLPPDRRAPLRADADRVRDLARELVALNHWLSVHLRIYLDAYRRLLRDLTRTAHHSGRYGRAGKAEVNEFRPLIQIQG
jgi:hypothetical protein